MVVGSAGAVAMIAIAPMIQTAITRHGWFVTMRPSAPNTRFPDRGVPSAGPLAARLSFVPVR